MKIISILILITMLFFFQCSANEALTPTGYLQTLTKAQNLYDQQQYDQALSLYESLVSYYADDSEIWSELADTYYQLKKYDDAARAYQKVETLAPSALTDYRIARCFAMGSDTEQALKFLKKALDAGYDRRIEIGNDSAFSSLNGNPLFSKLIGDSAEKSTDRNDGWRSDLAYLISEIRRVHYLYKYRSFPEGFEKSVQDLNKKIPDLTDQQIIVEMQGLMARLGDGHTVLFFFAGERALHQIPLNLYLFSDGLFVIDSPEPYKKWIGSRVKKINGYEPSEILLKLSPYVSKENSMFVNAIGLYYLRTPDFLKACGFQTDTERISLTLEDREGRTETVSVDATVPGPFAKVLPSSKIPGVPPPPLYMEKEYEPFWFQHMPDKNAVYFQFNHVMNQDNESLAQFSLRLRNFLDEHKVRNLIVDVRHNFGGDGMLLKSMIRTLIHFETAAPDQRLFVITGRGTFSAAQIFIAQVNHLTNAIFVGEPSSSSPNFVGEDTLVVLPYSKLNGTISSHYYQADDRDHRTWIAPKIPVSLSSQAYFSNQDPVLEEVFRAITNGH